MGARAVRSTIKEEVLPHPVINADATEQAQKALLELAICVAHKRKATHRIYEIIDECAKNLESIFEDTCFSESHPDIWDAIQSGLEMLGLISKVGQRDLRDEVVILRGIAEGKITDVTIIIEASNFCGAIAAELIGLRQQTTIAKFDSCFG